MKAKVAVLAAFLMVIGLGFAIAEWRCPDCRVAIANGDLYVEACLPEDCVQYVFYYRHDPAYPWLELDMVEEELCAANCILWSGVIEDFPYSDFHWEIRCGTTFPPECFGTYGNP